MNISSDLLSCLSRLFLVFGLFYSALGLAEDKAHTLSLQLDRSEDTIQIPIDHEDLSLESETAEVFYSFQYDEQIVLSASLLSGGVDGGGSNELDQDLSGFSGSVSYLKGNWALDVGFSVIKEKSKVTKTIFSKDVDSRLESFDFNVSYNEEYRSTDFFIGGSFDFEWQNFIFTPSLRLGQQISELDSLLEVGVSNYIDTNEESVGGYVAPILSIAYLWAGSGSTLWLPSVSFFWSETLWGDVDSHASKQFLGKKTTTKNTESTESGAGLMSTSMMVVFDAFYADLSFSRTIDVEPKSKSISLLLGLNF